MTKRMIVDATHPEETRVAIVDGNHLCDFDFERTSKKQLKGNIYLAKVIRIEPSLQAAFVEYGGNRHGFLSFTEIHPDYFRIPVADRPADEEDEELDDQDNGDEGSAALVEAYAADAAEANERLEERARENHIEPAVSLDITLETQVSEIAPPVETATHLTSEFAIHAENDLGLITDFGNATVDSGLAPDVAPLETVGGEVGDEERYRRPPVVARPRYKIQEVVKRRQVMLIQVVKEERGNKGAALTTFLSLAGRYCVLMPNTDGGGGVSRKITSHQDRRRMKEILDQLEIPEGMAVILRTAGMEQEPAEIQRDLEYLLRLWNGIREETLRSTAPALIYEEANLIKRSMRDLYAHDVDEILVSGEKGHTLACDFMRAIMPDQLDKVKLYTDNVPLFFRYNVEKQIDALYSPIVQLRSGGYIVINPTEALVSIDVNSGRATRERHIEGTALKTNLEAAEEIGRQVRLRDLAGLVVIDFIDMEDSRNNAAVERRMKESMRADRARLQIGRISPFGLLELSRQRLRPSLMEINFEKCPHCAGLGLIRSVDSAALSILRMIEEEGIRQGSVELVLHLPTKIALYILNQKRQALSDIENRYKLQVLLHSDDTLVQPDFRLERVRAGGEARSLVAAVDAEQIMLVSESTPRSRELAERAPAVYYAPESSEAAPREGRDNQPRGEGQGQRRGRFGGGRDRNRTPNPQQQRTPRPDQQTVTASPEGDSTQDKAEAGQAPSPDGTDQQPRAGRRRGRRGGRGRRPGGENGERPTQEQGEQQGENRAAQGEQRAPQGEPRQNQRPPRDPARQQHNDQRRENWNNRDRTPNARQQNNQQQNVQQQNAPVRVANSTPVSAPPLSVYDLDTTPRPHNNGHDRASTSATYDIVSDSSDKPKGGWWHRLTGQ